VADLLGTYLAVVALCVVLCVEFLLTQREKAQPPQTTPQHTVSPSPPAIAPFDAHEAVAHQAAWSRHIGDETEMTNSIGMAPLVLEGLEIRSLGNKFTTEQWELIQTTRSTLRIAKCRILVHKLSRSPLELEASDFQLKADSPGKGVAPGNDIGADVDRMGPGRPYAHWKTTPESKAWRERAAPGG